MGRQNRVLYLDLLRAAATLMVIMLHLSAQNWAEVDVMSADWGALNFWNSITRWSVPVFFMISGALFLDPERTIDTKRLYTVNILRLATAFIFWSLVYALCGMLYYHYDLLSVLNAFVSGHYHMWYLFTAAGLYMAVPLLRKITEDEKLTKYYLGISFIFNVVVYTLLSLVGPAIKHHALSTLISALKSDYNFMYLDFFTGFFFYFVLGHYLRHHEFGKKMRLVLYLLAIAGFFGTVVPEALISRMNGQPYGAFYLYLIMNGYAILYSSFSI